jgi:hypothetical protein
LDGHLDFLFSVNIASVEQYRSGKAGYDSADFSAPNTVPWGVYVNNGQNAPADTDVADHPTEVAGVMIGNTDAGATYEGVAPGAHLHSTAISDWTDQRLSAIAVQNMANKNVVPEMVAINFSWAQETEFWFGPSDGKSFFTQFVDWTAKRYDVVIVSAFPDRNLTSKMTPADN